MILCPCRETARGGSPMNDGTVTPTSPVHALVLGQLNCRRLWGRDGSVHDGFTGLVSCLDQSLCVHMRAGNSVSPDKHSFR